MKNPLPSVLIFAAGAKPVRTIGLQGGCATTSINYDRGFALALIKSNPSFRNRWIATFYLAVGDDGRGRYRT